MNKEQLLKKVPITIISVLFANTIFQLIKGIANEVLLYRSQASGEIKRIFLFGDPLTPNIVLFLLMLPFVIAPVLVATRIKVFQSKMWRMTLFLSMFLSIVVNFSWLVTSAVYRTLLPYLSDRADSIVITSEFERVLLEQTDQFLLILMSIPLVFIFLLSLYLGGLFTKEEDHMLEAFFEYEMKGKWLQQLSKIEKEDTLPDVDLGENSDTGEMVSIPGKDRTLNGIIVGSIGTGKTAALGLPMINQDMTHMARYINKYAELIKLANFESEDIKGSYLNGISIIEPSNDLCQKAYKLAKAHGIPDEAITYINPMDKDTPNINVMQGPVDKVAETFATVVEGLNESGDSNFFFEQSQRNHLKHYIYLLKLHNPEKEVTFDMLLDMYNNAQVVRDMHVKLKSTFPKDFERLQDRDEYNHWQIVKQIDEWFDQNLLLSTSHNGAAEKVKEGKYRGQDKYYDAKAEFVQGLRNILNDIGANPYIRRVLFGTSKFDFDVHLEAGGVLLLNTAKGDLVGLANVLGKLVLLSLQNAVFRRKPNVSTYHSIIVDEAPDYLYKAFREFPAQSRKYKVNVVIILQTISQLADRYGEYYMNTLIGTLRNRMIYGDLPAFDSKYFSEIFGEEIKYEESTTEQSVSALQDNPMTRSGSSYSKVKEARMTASDVIYQDAFQCSVKIVVDNKPLPVQQIRANFVPKEEFIEAKYRVIQENASPWLEDRKRLKEGMKFQDILEESIEMDEEQAVEDAVEQGVSVENEVSLENSVEKVREREMLERTFSTQHTTNLPKDEIHYQTERFSRLRNSQKYSPSDETKDSLKSSQQQSENKENSEGVITLPAHHGVADTVDTQTETNKPKHSTVVGDPGVSSTHSMKQGEKEPIEEEEGSSPISWADTIKQTVNKEQSDVSQSIQVAEVEDKVKKPVEVSEPSKLQLAMLKDIYKIVEEDE